MDDRQAIAMVAVGDRLIVAVERPDGWLLQGWLPAPHVMRADDVAGELDKLDQAAEAR